MPSAIERATKAAKAASKAGKTSGGAARTGRKETGSTTAAERRQRGAGTVTGFGNQALKRAAEALKRAAELETKKEETKVIQENTDEGQVLVDRLKSGQMTVEEVAEALKKADLGKSPQSTKDTLKTLAKFSNIPGAAKELTRFIKENVGQQSDLLDHIEETYGVDRKTAGEIADANNLTSTSRYNTVAGAAERKAQEVAARDDSYRGGSGGSSGGRPNDAFADFVSGKISDPTGFGNQGAGPEFGRSPGDANFSIPGLTQPKPLQAGDPNTITYSIGGKPVTFTPRSVYQPGVTAAELALKSRGLDIDEQQGIDTGEFRQDQLEAAEPGALDQLAGIGSLVSAIWG